MCPWPGRSSAKNGFGEVHLVEIGSRGAVLMDWTGTGPPAKGFQA